MSCTTIFQYINVEQLLHKLVSSWAGKFSYSGVDDIFVHG